jgi:hypothetical protein
VEYIFPFSDGPFSIITTMPTDQYQTPPKPSLLDPNVTLGDLDVKLDPDSLPDLDLSGLIAFQRAANYLAAAQIFLQSNALLEKPLTKDDIKPRLLGLSCMSTAGSVAHSRHRSLGDMCGVESGIRPC